jgi:hypothetical protein
MPITESNRCKDSSCSRVREVVFAPSALLDYHVRKRVRQWLCRKHKVPGRGTSRFPDRYLNENLGLVRLGMWMRNLPWANA